MENAHAHPLAGILDCQLDSLPSSYLGFPQGAKFKKKFIWEPVVDRFFKKKDFLVEKPSTSLKRDNGSPGVGVWKFLIKG